MERVPHIRQSAAACPSCGARRIISETRFCDQCGKRIPESLIKKLQEEKTVEPQGRASTAGTPRSLGLSDRAYQSAPAPSSSESMGKTHTGAVVREREMPHKEAETPATAPRGLQRILGMCLIVFGVLAALASAVVGIWNLGGLGLASFLIGLLSVYLNMGQSFSPELVEASLLSSLANVERVLRELGPETKALYLKINDRLDIPMVFIPLEENPAPPFELSLVDDDRLLVIDSNDPRKTGLLFEAPGASLLALMEKESGVDFIDFAQGDFLDPLRSGMVESLEVAADVKAIVTSEGVNFRIRDGALRGLSRSVVRSAPNVASRLGCPICSVAICATVKAAKRDVMLDEATHQPGSHTLSLRFARGGTNETS